MKTHGRDSKNLTVTNGVYRTLKRQGESCTVFMPVEVGFIWKTVTDVALQGQDYGTIRSLEYPQVPDISFNDEVLDDKVLPC